MKKLIILSLLILFTLNVKSQNSEKNFIDQNYIELTGTSKLELVPNEIYLSITINEHPKNSKKSVEEQEKLMIATLKNNSIDVEGNFKIIDFSSNFKHYFLKKTDIRKSKTYELMLTNGEEVAKVFFALEQIGISNVSIVKVHHSEYEKYRLETKVEAIKIAKKKAEKYAEAIGQIIGKAIFIQEVDVSSIPNYNSQYVIRGYANTSSKTNYKAFENLEFQVIEIDAKVLVRFEL